MTIVFALPSILVLAGIIGLACMLEDEYERLGRANPLKWAYDSFEYLSQRPWFVQILLWPLAIALFIAMTIPLAVINVLFIVGVVLEFIVSAVWRIFLDSIARLRKTHTTSVNRCM